MQREICSTYIFDVRSVPAVPRDSLYLREIHRFDPYHHRCLAIAYLDSELHGLCRWSMISMHQFSLEALQWVAGFPLRSNHFRQIVPVPEEAADSCNFVHDAFDFDPAWLIVISLRFDEKKVPQRYLEPWRKENNNENFQYACEIVYQLNHLFDYKVQLYLLFKNTLLLTFLLFIWTIKQQKIY